MNVRVSVCSRRVLVSVGRTVRAVSKTRASFATVTLLLLIGAAIFLWRVPEWQLGPFRSRLEPKDLAQLENAIRTTWAQILGGATLLVALYFTWRRIAAAERTVEVTRETQITERFTKAIDQLDYGKALEVRLGGIYALGRIAKDSEKDYEPIREVLTAYVRTHTPWPNSGRAAKDGPNAGKDAPPPTRKRPDSDIQAVLTVLRRLSSTGTATQYGLDLSESDLRGADLADTQLPWADLRGSCLSGADLRGTNLKDANLARADLSEADLSGAVLEDAILINANLQAADLREANLIGADLAYAVFGIDSYRPDDEELQELPEPEEQWDESTDADYEEEVYIRRADLRGADLTRAKGVTQAQIQVAVADKETKLPLNMS